MSTQTVADILRKVQQIQIVANRSVNDLLAGQYRSVFRGRGMEFDEVREYQAGDEIRAIDWNVTARAGSPYVKRFSEERELTVLFLLDVSASGAFGTGRQTKLEVMVEMAALLMFSALKNNDKVGLLLFAEEVQAYFPPRKGKSNVLRLIREMISVEPVVGDTSLANALQFLSRVHKRRSVVFLISDFQTVDSRQSLAVSNRRHDLVAITVSDPRERALPDVGFLSFRDAETGEVVEVDTRHPRVRDLFAKSASRRQETLSDGLRRVGVDELSISTTEPYAASLRRFFASREQRGR
ncbi:MAG: DUF58 domain-containing protein [Planctomycetaceae bacterium]|nr:DUF58 domain-containing protein [Planctomycetaceae bacterium]